MRTVTDPYLNSQGNPSVCVSPFGFAHSPSGHGVAPRVFKVSRTRTNRTNLPAPGTVVTGNSKQVKRDQPQRVS